MTTELIKPQSDVIEKYLYRIAELVIKEQDKEIEKMLNDDKGTKESD
jgi:hypothetical protein